MFTLHDWSLFLNDRIPKRWCPWLVKKSQTELSAQPMPHFAPKFTSYRLNNFLCRVDGQNLRFVVHSTLLPFNTMFIQFRIEGGIINKKEVVDSKGHLPTLRSLIIPLSLASIIVLLKQSLIITKRKGDNASPFLRPLLASRTTINDNNIEVWWVNTSLYPFLPFLYQTFSLEDDIEGFPIDLIKWFL